MEGTRIRRKQPLGERPTDEDERTVYVVSLFRLSREPRSRGGPGVRAVTASVMQLTHCRSYFPKT